jgi:aspartate carbamoyltransferase catalytic subunit
MTKRDLISIDDLSNDEILEIFALADEMATIHSRRASIGLLNGKIIATLFYEPSTRTRLSFEAATHRLGGSVISSPDMQASSSAAKGETIADTAKVVSQYADLIVIRHPWDGSARVAARHSHVPVINAGDGSHEHPTQTLCDLYTLMKEKGQIKGLTVALCGDLRFGRTVHSFAAALARFGAELVLIPGEDLEMPDYLLRRLAIKYDQKLERANLMSLTDRFKNFDAVYMAPRDPQQRTLFFGNELEINTKLDLSKKIKLDVVYMTRYQKERLSRELPTHDYPKLDATILTTPPFKGAIVMHPLPRLDELAKELDADPRSKYFAQVSYGLLVRMALLRFLLEPPQLRFPGFNTPLMDNFSTYESRSDSEPTCANENCISNGERNLPREFFILAREKTHGSHLLILECCYCAFEFSVSIVGNRKTKKYCQYDPALEEFVEYWLSQSALALFNGDSEAERLGFAPYVRGPQRQVMTSETIALTIEKLAKDIAAAAPELGDLCLIGLRNRGDIIAKRIASIIERDFSVKVPTGSLDVLPFRDDVHTAKEPLAGFDFTIENKIVVLVDDVLYSGRTTRAAMKGILSGLQHGRPKRVMAAVLIDRGHREFPIQPQFVGKHLPSSKMERVEVRLKELHSKDEVVIFNVLIDDEPEKISK